LAELQDAEPQRAPRVGPSPGLGSRALRNTALVLAARVASRLLALVTVIATGNHLGDAGFGRFQTLVNYTALVTVLVDLGFNTLYVREAARHPAQISRYLSNLVSARLLLALVALGVLAGVLRIPGLEDLLLPGFVLMMLASYSSLLRGSFYALQRLGYEALAIVLESAVLLGLTIAGIRSGQGVAYFLWAYAASYGFSCAYILTVLLARRMVRLRWRFEPGFVRAWFWAGLPFALTFVITTIYFKIDVPILQQFRSYAEVGWYTFAYKPFEALLFVPVTMLNVVFPVMSVYHRDAPDRLALAVDKFYKSLMLLGWPITVGVFVLAPGLNALLRLFPRSEPALEILALGIVFMFVNNAFIGALNSIDRQLAFTWAAGFSLVVNVACNLALIPPFGYLGASWATVLTEAALVAVGWTLTARYMRRVPVLRLSWKIVLAGLVMGAVLYPMRGFHGLLVVAAVLLGALVYTLALLLLRGIESDEVAMLRAAAGWRT
jgi:O-antigen/teichoic acid export membrane protein